MYIPVYTGIIIPVIYRRSQVHDPVMCLWRHARNLHFDSHTYTWYLCMCTVSLVKTLKARWVHHSWYHLLSCTFSPPYTTSVTCMLGSFAPMQVSLVGHSQQRIVITPYLGHLCSPFVFNSKSDGVSAHLRPVSKLNHDYLVIVSRAISHGFHHEIWTVFTL